MYVLNLEFYIIHR